MRTAEEIAETADEQGQVLLRPQRLTNESAWQCKELLHADSVQRVCVTATLQGSDSPLETARQQHLLSETPVQLTST